MISSREHGIVQIFAIVQTAAMAGVFWCWYLLLFWIRQEPYPFVQSYAKYFIVVILAMVFECLTRPQSLRLRLEEMRRLAWPVSRRQVAWIVVAIFALQIFSKDYGLSRVFLAGFIVLSWSSFYLLNRHIATFSRPFFAHFLKNRRVRTILLGPKEWCDSIQLELNLTTGYMNLTKIITIEKDDERDIRELMKSVADEACDLLVLPHQTFFENTVMSLVKQGDRLGYRCWLPVEFSRSSGLHFSLQKVGRLDVLTPPVKPLENISNRLIKRVFDLLVGWAACLTILPLCCLFVWILHRCFSPGPLFFKQERGGRNGLPFMIYKFRSLHVDNGNEVTQVTKSDDRIFKGGRLIRKTSIDEIPQFINVVLGNMSVVGPRPHMIEHDKKFSELYEKYGHRRYVKPGVTGLAQVKGFRGEIHRRLDLRHRATLDCFYVSRWDLGFDIKIILLTVVVIFFPPKSAY